LRPLCLVALIALVIQLVLGTILNLYVTIPDYSHASYVQEIAKAPGYLTVHALVGLTLLGTAVLLIVQAAALRAAAIITLLATGLAAMLGAFIAGEVFVRSGTDTASLWMSLLTGVALASYIGVQAVAGSASRSRASRSHAAPQPE
jgi:thiol:disulfide interchange protein